jgi:single-stranded-DNA-specific exonuclease
METLLEIMNPDRKDVAELAAALKCHPVLSTLLLNRGIADDQAALDFLQPSLSSLRPPDDLCDITTAVRRIAAAIEKNEKILVFGDYDVDGVTATCLLTEFLDDVGAEVSYHIPHRIEEGYSLNPDHIHNGAVPPDTRLIITVDCGVSSRQAVAAAGAAGIDVIVTDHHVVTSPLPEAIAVVNPNRRDCPSGLGDLPGVGVVFYLIIALRKELRARQHFTAGSEPNLKQRCDLVALGTVADMVPLTGENRVLTAVGLDIINRGTRAGLNQLIDASRIQHDKVDSEDIAYRLAPRLNAAGRLNHASEAVELLRAGESAPAAKMAAALDRLNSKRREIEQATCGTIADMLARSPDLVNRPAIVLADAAWHPGITGIAAARLARQHHLPVFLICLSNGIGKGSGRSIPGVDIISCLHECAPVLDRYGGHPSAAGITLNASNLDKFRLLFEEAVKKRVAAGIPPETLRVDCELELAGINPGLMEILGLMQPFGQGNPEPLFLARKVIVRDAKTVGRDHTRLMLAQDTPGKPNAIAAIFFNSGTVPDKADEVVFALRWNHWRGRKTIQAVIKYMA